MRLLTLSAVMFALAGSAFASPLPQDAPAPLSPVARVQTTDFDAWIADFIPRARAQGIAQATLHPSG